MSTNDTYLAMFLGGKGTAKAAAWEKLPEAERNAKAQRGIAAWKAWVEKHQSTIVTMGAQGAVLVQKDLRLRAGVYPVPFVDPSGGGDAFDAGYICGLLQGSGPEDCLRLASALGASCVRAIGTTPGVFTRLECDAFMKTHCLHIERL